MAEVKNLFLKSKMNQDLDDRLVPSGEYRQAQNVMISKSEGSDVGALENVLGNELVAQAILSLKAIGEIGNVMPENISVIGKHIDENNDRIFLWLTNYIDNSTTGLQHPQLNNTGTNQMPKILNVITCYNIITQQFNVLTRGIYLNFSKGNIITGSNVLENLLFWTDNRNQPRKINIDRALNNATYYTTEDQISVAKYYPYSPVRLWANEMCGGQVIPQPQMKNKSNDANPVNYGQSKYNAAGAPTNPNPTYDPNFSGDPSFLEDKFVRFSYRFIFDDNEISVMAPFSQTSFIPKQDGYFILNLPDVYNGIGDGINSTQEDAAYKSTVVEFMENKVDSINLFIDLPCPANELASKLKVDSLEIIYKEANSISVKVIKTIEVTDDMFNTSDSYINWEYKSNKPIKTLPERETTRVFDRVPIRSLTQEITGNRLVYGNYTTMNNYPSFIDYKVGVSEKLNTNVNPPSPTSQKISSRVAYPNHTLKQNRNYQVGIVLADRYGRQTPVILSPPNVSEEVINGITFKNSTIYHPYKKKGGEEIIYWVGDSLKLLFNTPIEVIDGVSLNKGLYDEIKNPLGWYSYKVVVKQTETDYYNVYLPGMLDGYLEYTADSVVNTISHAVLINDNINKVPRDLREVGPTQSTFGSSVRLFGRVNNIATKYQANPAVEPYSALTNNQPYNSQYYPGQSPDSVVTIGTLSDLGMGQTKTVILSHRPALDTVANSGDNVYVSAFSSNIFDNCTVLSTSTNTNPIPTGALVKNYRQNPDYKPQDQTATGVELMAAMFNIDAEEYPFDIEAGAALTFTNPTFYNSPSNPLIVRMATKKGLGSYVTPGPDKSLVVLPELTVMETSPVESSLDIYWETSTTGLISDLNAETSQPFGPRDIGPEFRFIGDEGDSPLTEYLFAQNIYAIDQAGAQVAGAIDWNNSFVTRAISSTQTETLTIGTAVSDFFRPISFGTSPNFQYNLQLQSGKYWMYGQNYAQSPFKGALAFTFKFIPDDTNINPVILSEQGQVSNVAPIIELPAGGFPPKPAILAFTWPEIISCKNGSSDPTRDTDELLMALTSQVSILDPFTQVQYFELFQNTSTNGAAIEGEFKIRVLPNSPSGTYTLVTSLVDANGFGVTTQASISITLQEPGLGGTLTNGTIQYGMWSGHYGYFSKTNIPSSNEYSSVGSGSTAWEGTDQIAPLPAMLGPVNYLQRPAYDTSNNSRYSMSGSSYLESWSAANAGGGKPGVDGSTGWKTSASDYNAPLGTWAKHIYDTQVAAGKTLGFITDWVSTFSSTTYSWPLRAGYIWLNNTSAFGGGAWTNATYNTTYQDGGTVNSGGGNYYTPCVVGTRGANSSGSTRSITSATATRGPNGYSWWNLQVAPRMDFTPLQNGSSWHAGPYTTGDITMEHRHKQIVSINGMAFGWGYYPRNTNSDNWLGGGGTQTDKNNQFLLPNYTRGAYYTSGNPDGIVGSADKQNKKWFSFFGNFDSQRDTSNRSGDYHDFGWGFKDGTSIKYNFPINNSYGTGPNQNTTNSYNDIVKFRNRLNVQLGEKGLVQGTALIRIVMDHWNYEEFSTWASASTANVIDPAYVNSLQDGVLFSNFVIEYRPDENSSWSRALDINDEEIAMGLWDCNFEDFDVYGKSSALFYRGPISNRYLRNISPNLGYREGSGGTDYYRGNNRGMVIPDTYKENEGHGMVKWDNTDLSKADWSAGCEGLRFDVKQGRENESDTFEAGIGIRNYSGGRTSGGDPVTVASPGLGQGYAEVCFAVNKPGDYRFVFDNLRQGINRQANGANLNAGALGGRPYFIATQIGAGGISTTTKSLGPGVSVQVSDLYNERPQAGCWGLNAPTAPFKSTTLDNGYNQQNHKYDVITEGANYTFYAYVVQTNGTSTRIEGLDINNWDPANENYTYLYAKEPVFRYVSKFYTRVNSGGSFVYSIWRGSSSNKWFAYTQRYVSPKKNTIPDPNEVGQGAFNFPEQAGVPFGGERAFGPRIGTGNVEGVYETWSVQVEASTGTFIGTPIPASYLDLYDVQPSWYNDSVDWSQGPRETTTQSPDAP
jgi:hypothetical protein